MDWSGGQPPRSDQLAGREILEQGGSRFEAIANTGGSGLQVQLTLTAPRRFVPSTGRVAPDGPRKPWPAAPLSFTFVGVTDMRFDAEDRIGVTVNCGDAGPSVAIGHCGRLQSVDASIWPDDPRWFESAAGRAAGAAAPHERPERQRPVRTSSLTSQQRAAARALGDLMIHIRLVNYYPRLAAQIPVREICRVAADAGTAILAASANHGSARQKAFAELEERWRYVPPDVAPAPIRSGPGMLRYAGYDKPHDHYDVPREGSAVLVPAVPDADPTALWNLASEEITQSARFQITNTVFDGIQQFHHDADALTIGATLVVQPQGQPAGG